MDSFVVRIHHQELVLKELLEEYLQEGIFDGYQTNQTCLTYLFLKNQITFTDEEYKYIIGLNATQGYIYDRILDQVKYTTHCLSREIYPLTLDQIPLTSMKLITYQVALVFKYVFFVPSSVEINDRGKRTTLTRFISKFNEMWVITSMIIREFKDLLVEFGE